MKTDNAHAKLLRQYHTICRILGIDAEERRAIASGYGVNSSKDLTNQQLVELLTKLHGDAHRWRRRVMAVIGAYLRRINYTENADTIKAVACRAAGYDDFNRIPVSRLRSVYYEFLRRNKTADGVDNEIAFIEQSIVQLN